MSKLDALANKIGEKLLPKIRKIVREELEYALEHVQDRQPPSMPNGKNPPKGKSDGDYSAVMENMRKQMGQGNPNLKMENALIDGADGSDVITDEQGNTISTAQLAKSNPKVAERLERISNQDYSKLLD